jgi:hypothetical protein
MTHIRRCALLALVAAALAAPSPSRALPGAVASRRMANGRGVLRLTTQRRQELARFASPTDITVPHLNYYGGRVMANLKVVGAYWGSVDAALRARLDAFYPSFAASDAFTWLTEYNTTVAALNGRPGTNQQIAPGSYLGGFILKPNTSSATIGEDDLIAALSAAIDAGGVPPSDGDTLYAIHTPPGITISDSSGTSCHDYCAFHDSFTKNGAQVMLALLPDHSPGSGCDVGCGNAADWFDNLTTSASHEVIEAVTDPELGSGNFACGPAWCDPQPSDQGSSHDEIADICAGVSASDLDAIPITGADGKTWTVQREWSNRAGACIATRADAITLTLSPPQQTVHGPGTYDFTLSTTSPQSGPTTVKLGTYTLPSGVTATIDQPSITTGGSTTLHVTIVSGASAATFGVFAETGRAHAVALGQLGYDDFAASSPSGLNMKAGDSANVQIDTQTAPGSLSQAVSIHLTGKPPGVTMNPNTVTLDSGQSATVSVNAAAGSPSLTKSSLTFTLTNGLTTHTLQVPFTLEGDDFTATTTAPTPLIVRAGSNVTFKIATQTANGNPQQLRLSAKQVQPGLNMSFDRTTLQSGETAVATLSATGSAQLGMAQFTVTVAGVTTSTDLSFIAQIQAGGCASTAAATPEIAALALALVALRGAQRRRRPAM